MESAIDKHLICPRTLSRRVADDYQPPFPMYVARAAEDLSQVVMGYFGVQYSGAGKRSGAGRIAPDRRRFRCAGRPEQLRPDTTHRRPGLREPDCRRLLARSGRVCALDCVAGHRRMVGFRRTPRDGIGYFRKSSRRAPSSSRRFTRLRAISRRRRDHGRRQRRDRGARLLGIDA